MRWKTRASNLWVKLVACAAGILLCLVLIPAVSETSALGIPLAVGAGFLALAVQQWRRHRHGEFVLRADSLSYSGWLRPLIFSEIATLTTTTSYGAVTVIFRHRDRLPGIWRYSALGWIKTRSISLPMNVIAVKQEEALKTLSKYLTRNTEQV